MCIEQLDTHFPKDVILSHASRLVALSVRAFNWFQLVPLWFVLRRCWRNRLRDVERYNK
jgi:hypothetical protein